MVVGSTSCHAESGRAAALVLVGWYLMVPPITTGSKKCPPVSAWKRHNTFTLERDCAKGLAALQRPYAENMEMGDWDNCGDMAHRGICIASNDPRVMEHDQE